MHRLRTQRVHRLARALACIALICGPASTPSQDLRYLSHQSWSTEDGLPQNSVHRIYQADDGFLWIATEGGIARFDGLTFTIFNRSNEPAFLSDDTCCLAETGEGSLWIGTNDGLLRLKDHRFTRFAEQDGLPSSSIQDIVSTVQDRLLVKTAHGSAEWKNGRFKRLGPDADVDSISTPNPSHPEAWTFSIKSVVLTSGLVSRKWTVGQELPGSRIDSLFVDRKGAAWIGTNDGLAVIGKGSTSASVIPSLHGNAILQTFEDREGNDWIGTDTSGLHLLRQSKFRSEPALADKTLTGVIQATDGSVWAGTRKDGLLRLRNGIVDVPAKPESLTSPFILSLAPGLDGSVWVGTPDGLNHVSAQGVVERITSAEGLPDDYIVALAASEKGTAWAGTRHGLVRLQGKEMGILTKADGLGGDLIGALLLAKNGDLWIGTSGGLARLGANGKLTTPPNERQPMIVSAFAEDTGSTLWIMTKDGHIVRSNGSGLRPVKGLTFEAQGITADRLEFLWVRDQRGMERAPLGDLNRCADTGETCVLNVRHYGLADGMPSVELVAGGSPLFWTMANGELWSPTRRGVAITDPTHLPINLIPPPVVIERLLVADSAIDLQGRPIQIPYGHDRLTIEYAGLSYTAPSEVRYRFQLDGFDPSWIDAGNRRYATYTNLPPAFYRFRVQAMNNDGIWNETGATLEFRIVPPIYRRWWFLALSVLSLCGIVAALYRFRLRRLQRQFDAVLKERNRMAREIHDTLAQDFVGVTLQLDIIAQLLGFMKIDAAIQQVQQTRRFVVEGLADARKSIWELRANLAHDSLPTRLGKVVTRYSIPPVVPRLKIGGAFRKLDRRIEDEVLRIAQESLSNVQRHSGATHASIELHYGDDKLILCVEDDGRGFIAEDALQKSGHYGLSGMKERTAVIGATLEIASTPGVGTKVTLTVPLDGVEG